MSLEDLLPPDYAYKIVKKEVISLSDFKCEIRASIRSKESFGAWLVDFEERTNTTWILRNSKVNDGSKGFQFSRDYSCHHSSYRKRKVDGKNKNCNASLTIRIKKDTKFIRCRDSFVKEGLLAILNIKFKHSHRIDVEEAWNWLCISDETKSAFDDYFNRGLSPSAAKNYHESMLVLDGPEQIANSHRNPSAHWIYQRYEKWFEENSEDFNIGPDFQHGESSSDKETSCDTFKWNQDSSILTSIWKRMKQKNINLKSKSSCPSTSNSVKPIPKLLTVASGSDPETLIVPDLPENLSGSQQYMNVKIKKEPDDSDDSFSLLDGGNPISLPAASTNEESFFQPVSLVKKEPITKEEEPLCH